MQKFFIHMQILFKITLWCLGIFTAAMILLAGYYWSDSEVRFFILLALGMVSFPVGFAWFVDKSTESDYVKINIAAIIVALLPYVYFPLMFIPHPTAVLLSLLGFARFLQHKNKNGGKEDSHAKKLLVLSSLFISGGMLYFQIYALTHTTWH